MLTEHDNNCNVTNVSVVVLTESCYCYKQSKGWWQVIVRANFYRTKFLWRYMVPATTDFELLVSYGESILMNMFSYEIFTGRSTRLMEDGEQNSLMDTLVASWVLLIDSCYVAALHCQDRNDWERWGGHWSDRLLCKRRKGRSVRFLRHPRLCSV